MKDLFYEIIKEAENANITIDNEVWNIGFNTIIKDKNIEYYNDEKNVHTLVIKNEEEFFRYLQIYINKELMAKRKSVKFLHDTPRNRIKFLISYLFVNASPMDFVNPIEYLKKRIAYLNDNTFDDEKYINLEGKDIYLKIKKVSQDVRMETPKRIEFSIVNLKKDLEFKLPSISYGIRNMNNMKYCDIYSIHHPDPKQKGKNDEEQKFIKKMSRLLYKVDAGEIDHDVKDVSASALISLASFISLLKENNITHMSFILCLPIGYYSREISAENIKDIDRQNYLFERNDTIQNNITNKFLRTIRRLATQIEGINIKNIDTVDDGYLEVELNKNKYNTNNPLLNSVTSSILKR